MPGIINLLFRRTGVAIRKISGACAGGYKVSTISVIIPKCFRHLREFVARHAFGVILSQHFIFFKCLRFLPLREIDQGDFVANIC